MAIKYSKKQESVIIFLFCMLGAMVFVFSVALYLWFVYPVERERFVSQFSQKVEKEKIRSEAEQLPNVEPDLAFLQPWESESYVEFIEKRSAYRGISSNLVLCIFKAPEIEGRSKYGKFQLEQLKQDNVRTITQEGARLIDSLSELNKLYPNKFDLILAAFLTSPEEVSRFQGVPPLAPVLEFVDTVEACIKQSGLSSP